MKKAKESAEFNLDEKGITIVALIITIIVLIILAAVTIISVRNFGIVNFATKRNAKLYNITKCRKSISTKYYKFIAKCCCRNV